MRLAAERTEAENLFETLANKSPVGLCIVQDGRFCYTNPTFQSNTGYREDELLGRNSLELAVPEDRKLVRENAIKMLKGELTSPYQFRVIHNDGSIHWVMESVAPVQYRGRQATLGYFVDITERKRIEEQYELLADYSADIIYRLRLMDERFIYVSPSVERILGYTTQEKLTLQPKDVLTQESYEKQKSQMLKDIENGVLQHTLQLKAVHRDGHIVPVEVHASFICDETGQPVEIVGVVRDITERKKVEETLELQRAYFQQLFDNSPDAIVMVDMDGRIVQANQAFETLFGYPTEEIKGRLTNELIIPEDHAGEASASSRTISDGGAIRKETVRRHKDGSLVDVSIVSYPIRFDDKLVGAYIIYSDITEHKKMEEAIKQAAEEWRKTFDSMSEPISIHDRDFRLQRVNKAFADMCHVKPRQVIGKLCYEVMADMHETIPNCPHQETLRTGKPAKTEFFVVKKGAYIEISTSPIFNKKREVVGTVHITRDITERKRMEEALRQSEENYRALFDGSVTGTFVLDAETRKIMMANQAAAKMFGFSSAEELIGADTLNNVPAEDKESVSELMAKNLFEQDLQRTHEFRTITKDGREIWISANAARIIHNGKLACLACFTDITEQKQQNERLIMTDRLACIGELASGAAHELNNPLASIIGFSQLLMEKEAPDDIREDLKIINSEAQRAAIVTNNLLAFARKHAPMKQPNQINNIIEDVLELRAREHELNHIDVESHLAPNLPETLVDYFQMQQVFMNIIINAEYFITKAHNGGTLTITTQKENSTVRISIADDGPGISPEDMGRIFDPFFTTKEAGSGTGLGLSICHGIVNEHGGQIYVRSQLGKGATIFIELPIKNRAHIKSLL